MSGFPNLCVINVSCITGIFISTLCNFSCNIVLLFINVALLRLFLWNLACSLSLINLWISLALALFPLILESSFLSLSFKSELFSTICTFLCVFLTFNFTLCFSFSFSSFTFSSSISVNCLISDISCNFSSSLFIPHDFWAVSLIDWLLLVIIILLLLFCSLFL